MPPVPGGLLDVAAQSASSAVAIGARALVAVWNGAVWKMLSDPGLPQLSALGAVAVFPGGAWAVGEYGLTDHGDGGGVARPLIVRVTGTTMRRVPVPKLTDSSALEDVAATSATDAWAVGFTGQGPLVLHWNGTAWTRTQLPAALARRVVAVDTVAATSAANAWAVIRFRTHDRLMHWNGSQWGQVVIPDLGLHYGISSLAATSARNFWAVEWPGGILHWNGRRWTCALSQDSIKAVSTSSADNAWAVGLSSYGGGPLAWHWNGQTWKPATPPGPDSPEINLNGVAVIPGSGGAWAFGGTGGGTLMLYWNGTAWR
jgi:hypothetical protein